MARWRGFGFGCMAVCLLGCGADDDRQDPVPPPRDGFYLEGSVRGAAGDSLLTVLLQGRSGGPEDPVYPGPLDLSLDGAPLEADSSRLGGTFYELQLPVDRFSGLHVLEGTLPGGRSFRESFTYTPIRFAAAPPAQLPRDNFRLALRGLPAKAHVAVVLTDTAFLSNDLNELLVVKNGVVTLTPKQLSTVQSGPVHLQLTAYQELDLKPKQGSAGRIRIEYLLEHDLDLVD